MRQEVALAAAVAGDLLPTTYSPQTSDPERQKFTGHERDKNGGATHAKLDYMHARYYSPYMGRFMSVDPINSASVTAPKSWNKYAYARNSPLVLVDPDGLADNRTEEDVAILEDVDVRSAVGDMIDLTGYDLPLAQRQEVGAVIREAGPGDFEIEGGIQTDGNVGSVNLRIRKVNGKPVREARSRHDEVVR